MVEVVNTKTGAHRVVVKVVNKENDDFRVMGEEMRVVIFEAKIVIEVFPRRAQDIEL